MASKPKVKRFRATFRVVTMVEVEVAGENLAEALSESQDVTLKQMLVAAPGAEFLDYSFVQQGVSEIDRWNVDQP
jgi:hypothetical protein